MCLIKVQLKSCMTIEQVTAMKASTVKRPPGTLLQLLASMTEAVQNKEGRGNALAALAGGPGCSPGAARHSAVAAGLPRGCAIHTHAYTYIVYVHVHTSGLCRCMKKTETETETETERQRDRETETEREREREELLIERFTRAPRSSARSAQRAVTSPSCASSQIEAWQRLGPRASGGRAPRRRDPRVLPSFPLGPGRIEQSVPHRAST